MAEHSMKKEIELLAPAGSYETFQAVIRAGADAVYLGGNQFGARAYANNFSEDELLKAIDFAHIHGREVYLTVNTLFKEKELLEQLYDYLLPYYRHGLDAVIVQDLGALALIRERFPEMDIHTSTQMTVTSVYGAAYMKELGASRIVTAREMSLAEIRKIHEEVGVEIESFVHGALCYCYSGQCLLSSMLGGRSGNRGRCAQPCRLPYEVLDEKMHRIKTTGEFVLSPKDLCGISYIPDMAESGIYSFKIEGRMKQAEYAAGVVSVYRHYIDMYLEELGNARKRGLTEEEAKAVAKRKYQVASADRERLLDMGNRSGFTDGYYYKQNGTDMITFGKPNHAKTNERLQEEIREKYVHAKAEGSEIKEKIKGILRLKKDSSATVEVQYKDWQVASVGDIVQEARNQPLSKEKVVASMNKTGSTPFVFEELIVEMDDDIFMPVKAINELRREALEQLETTVLDKHRRRLDTVGDTKAVCSYEDASKQTASESHVCAEQVLHAAVSKENFVVSIENRSLLGEILNRKFVDCIYLDSSCYDRKFLLEQLKEDVAAVHRAGKTAYYILPAIFRDKTRMFYEKIAPEFLTVGLEGIVVKSYDAAAFVKKYLSVGVFEHSCNTELALVLDHSVYTWNSRAKELLWGLNPLRDTVPLELNRREMFGRDNRGSEVLIYGYLPLMTSAQCVHANTGKCDAHKTVTYLKDRYGKHFPVKNNCAECYNVLYNTTPVMLFGFRKDFYEMGIRTYRIAFTVEDRTQAAQIMEVCEQTFVNGDRTVKEVYEGPYTNGHYKRGVE